LIDENHDWHRSIPYRAFDKKQHWLLEKGKRPKVHLSPVTPKLQERPEKPQKGAPLDRVATLLKAMPPRPGERVLPVTTLSNQWTRDHYPVFQGEAHRRRFQHFLRDHFTGQTIQIDLKLFSVLVASAQRFRSSLVEVVSGYRSPKYNLMLRKKGRQVARESQHTFGTAVDFRVRGASTEQLRDFVRSLRVGGVGYYPKTRFIHADTGKVRTWKGS
jgi:uncharacterized protein YcbK (DUF882 family)